MTAGIYTITNIPEWAAYVGASGEIEARWHQHRSTLKSGTHRSGALQRDWDRLGADSFVFAVALEMAEGSTAEELATAERDIIARMAEDGYRLYNRLGIAIPPMQPAPVPMPTRMVPLAEIRRDRNLTQAQLAAAIGVSRNSVTRWEMDGQYAARPNASTVRYLASVLGVEPGEIGFGTMGRERKRGRPPAPAEVIGEGNPLGLGPRSPDREG